MDQKGIQNSINTFLDERLIRLESKPKLAILVAAVALPLALFYFLLYSPKHKEISALQTTKAGLEQEIGTLEAKARKLVDHQAEMADVDRRFKIASLLIPEQKEIPSLLTSISGLATNSGLDVLTFTPKKELPRDFYAEIPVDMQVKGTYHNFGYFLHQVSHMPRVASISNIKLSAPSTVSGQMRLQIEFDLTTYRSLSPDESTAIAGK